MPHARLYHIAPRGKPKSVRPSYMWSRPELRALFALHGRMVMANHWRDYALGGESFGAGATRGGRASFHVFRHAAEHPLYVIEKWTPSHGAPVYRIRGAAGQHAARYLHDALAWLARQRFQLMRAGRR